MSASSRPERPVLLVTGHVPPDRVGAMRSLHESQGIEIAIYDGRLHHATAGVEDPGVPSRRVRQRSVFALAAAGGHRAVIATSAGRVALPSAYAGARRAGVPFLYWTGIWAPIRTPAHLAAAPLMQRIERGADAVITYGPHVSAYVRSHGARNVHVAPQAVDVGFWSDAGDAAAGRALAGGDGFLAVFAGRDSPGKGLPELLAAWEASGLAREGGVLALAGAGPEAAGAAPGVRALGMLDAAPLRNLYAAADVLLVPSVPTPSFREPWGLVVNEAMLQDTAVIASDAVGAAAGGLVRDGSTGLVVAAGDPGALALAMRRLAEDRELRGRLAAAGRESAAQYTYAACAAGVGEALASVGAARGDC
jgi:glycosyltransferase involved in cell wall biosynthesis